MLNCLFSREAALLTCKRRFTRTTQAPVNRDNARTSVLMPVHTYFFLCLCLCLRRTCEHALRVKANKFYRLIRNQRTNTSHVKTCTCFLLNTPISPSSYVTLWFSKIILIFFWFCSVQIGFLTFLVSTPNF